MRFAWPKNHLHLIAGQNDALHAFQRFDIGINQ
jgi:hypothetical protein